MTNHLDINLKEYAAVDFVELACAKQTLSALLFEDCTFTDCNFSHTLFAKCKFNDCRFINSNLSVIDLAYSQFRGVDFEDCKILGVDWSKADWPKISFFNVLNFQRCILSDSSFFGLNLEEINMQECRAHDVDFRSCNLRDANLSYTDFANSLFNKTNLSGADLTECINYDINIYNNDIKKAKFSRYEATRLLNCLDIELLG